jgi:hypothetical protein
LHRFDLANQKSIDVQPVGSRKPFALNKMREVGMYRDLRSAEKEEFYLRAITSRRKERPHFFNIVTLINSIEYQGYRG